MASRVALVLNMSFVLYLIRCQILCSGFFYFKCFCRLFDHPRSSELETLLLYLKTKFRSVVLPTFLPLINELENLVQILTKYEIFSLKNS